MTKEEFKTWCKHHGLSIEKAAKILGKGRQTGFDYASGKYDIDKSVINQCELIDMLSDKIKLDYFKIKLAEVR